jgi:5-methylcytosine-specific restriction endonuclease McrA
MKNPDIVKKRVREWEKTHKEKVNKRFRLKYKNNPDVRKKVAQFVKNWRKNNPERVRILHRNRRFKKRNAGNGWNADQEIELFFNYGNICAYCGKKFNKLTVDHIIPIAKGGIHEIENAVPACIHCNSSKCDTPLLIWMWRRRMDNG